MGIALLCVWVCSSGLGFTNFGLVLVVRVLSLECIIDVYLCLVRLVG